GVVWKWKEFVFGAWRGGGAAPAESSHDTHPPILPGRRNTAGCVGRCRVVVPRPGHGRRGATGCGTGVVGGPGEPRCVERLPCELGAGRDRGSSGTVPQGSSAHCSGGAEYPQADRGTGRQAFRGARGRLARAEEARSRGRPRTARGTPKAALGGGATAGVCPAGAVERRDAA